MTPSAETLLARLVAIPSPSGQEGAIAGDVQTLAQGWGLSVHRQGHNLWFEVGQGFPRVLVNSHLDTVGAGEGWDTNPLAPTWKGDRLYGLGANDAKGCVASILCAAAQLAEATACFPGTAVFALTAEEETGGQGLATILDRLGPLDAALVGEPTGLQAVIAQRGMLLLKCTAHGASAHAAHSRLGENAIHKAARDIAKLATMAFEGHPLLGEARPQVTQVGGGLARNQVPDTCDFFIDLRTTPNLDAAILLQRIQGELESEVRVHSARYLPKATNALHPIAQAALAASGQSGFVGSHTTSDWAFLGDIPAVKVGPGDTHRSHRPNEFLTRKELADGVAFYVAAIQGYFALSARETAHAC
jgi:acetylornithine deacetylase